MNRFLVFAFLFFIGSVAGWCIELLFRHFTNPERKWINPGFCVGPYVPLYGFGLCLLYLIASLEALHLIQNPLWNRVVLFLVMAVSMTAIEYIAGILSLKWMKVRLWDYSNLRGNIQGIICPQFSAIWAAAGAVYYFVLHPVMEKALGWLSRNLAFSFVIGMFYGVFCIDVVYSAKLISKIKRFAEENGVIIRYERLKAHIHTLRRERKLRISFFFPLHTDRPLGELLKDMRGNLERIYKKR